MLTDSERFAHECDHKRPYDSKRAAKRALSIAMSRGSDALGIYRCTWCERWHLGHRNTAKWQSRETVAS